MARKPIPGKDEGTWGDILNEYLEVAHAADGSLKAESITEEKLAPGVVTKLNAVSTSTPTDDSVTTVKLADGAVTNAKVATNANIAQSKIANLTTDLASKASTSHTHTIANVTGLQSALDDKAATNHTHPAPSLRLDDLTDVNASSATTGQVLTWQGSAWSPASPSAGVTDHGTLSGLLDDDHPQYLNNSRGDARYYTRTQVDTAMASKASTSHTHTIANVTGLQSTLDDKAATNHTHDASTIDAGVLSTARLGTGTADASTVLYGDGTWKTPSSGVTNLDSSPTATTVTVSSDTGSDATLAAATTSNAGVMSATDKTKLNSIASGATANASDAALRDRSAHTGTQAISTVNGLQIALDEKAVTTETVGITGSQTIDGVKTYSSSPIVPNPTTDSQAANKAYVDSVVGSVGGFSLAAVTTTADYNAMAGQWVIADASSGALNVNLPTPTSGAWIKVKKLDNSVNSVIVWPPAGQINAGAMTSNSITMNTYGLSYDFWADGSQWHIA